MENETYQCYRCRGNENFEGNMTNEYECRLINIKIPNLHIARNKGMRNVNTRTKVRRDRQNNNTEKTKRMLCLMHRVPIHAN